MLLVEPLFVINSLAPIRINDFGGWTDVRFAKHGCVLNIAVSPCVEVQLRVFDKTANRPRVVIVAENYKHTYEWKGEQKWDQHPLIEACLMFMNVVSSYAFEVAIFSEAPAGASTGTSSAVSVALIAALDCLNGGSMTPKQIAISAHRVETEILLQECGVQDGVACAYGGISLIEVDKFPSCSHSSVLLPDSLWYELERRLVLIFLGKSHHSSGVHKLVIERLQKIAKKAKASLEEGNWKEFGEMMKENTELQRELHSQLISTDHQAVIDMAQRAGCLGWKVNGAGGDGGSVTLLCSHSSADKRALIRQIEATPHCVNVPIALSRGGVRVWRSDVK